MCMYVCVCVYSHISKMDIEKKRAKEHKKSNHIHLWKGNFVDSCFSFLQIKSFFLSFFLSRFSLTYPVILDIRSRLKMM